MNASLTVAVIIEKMQQIFEQYSEHLQLIVDGSSVQLITDNDIISTHTIDEMAVSTFHQLADNIGEITEVSHEKALEVLTWLKIDSNVMKQAVCML